MNVLTVKAKTEAAFLRVLQPYGETQELTGFQWVWRFFAGTLKDRRISVVAGTPAVSLHNEDGTPITWDVPVTVELITPRKHVTGEEHDAFVSVVMTALIDGTLTKAAVNDAMKAEGFNALFWMMTDSPEDEADDKMQKSRITGTLTMMPVEPAGG